MRPKCLVVAKSQETIAAQDAIIASIKKHADVDVITTTEMIKNQGKYTQEKWYAALVTLGGDGAVLKAVSIYTPKLGGSYLAAYIDKLGDEHTEMHSYSETGKKREFYAIGGCGTYVPLVFAFDQGYRGRLCNIRRNSFPLALSSLIDYLKSSAADRIVMPQVLKRHRFAVNGCIYAMNEIYIFAKEKGFLDNFEVKIDDQYVHKNLRCDGVIICTDAGSSGYNASALGPVVFSGLECMVITTVCPADRRVSPIVLGNRQKIRIRSMNPNQKLAAIIDGCLRVEDFIFAIEDDGAGSVMFADFSEAPRYQDFVSSIQEK
ncbi:NAD+ kinase [Nematocida displodere]|uniref:NAD+ kinase n=1 Tax=Nematocida displodere TaxID=1805483 RepID=A0A177EAN3_9MICR|nr:NAD+ kinase [Nematocida displodere]